MSGNHPFQLLPHQSGASCQREQAHGGRRRPRQPQCSSNLVAESASPFQKKKKRNTRTNVVGHAEASMSDRAYAAPSRSALSQPRTEFGRNGRREFPSASWRRAPESARGERSPQGKAAEHATSWVTTLRKLRTTHCRTSTREGKNPKHGRQHVMSEFNGFSELTRFSIPDVYFAELYSNCARKPPAEVSFWNATCPRLEMWSKLERKTSDCD